MQGWLSVARQQALFETAQQPYALTGHANDIALHRSSYAG